jgi:WD40 repeat protein
LAVTAEGKHFASGGQDGILRIWNYDEGICYYEGEGHSGSINKIKISPDQRRIISVGSEGAIFFWDMPEAIIKDKVEPELPTLTKTSQNQKNEEKSVKNSVKGSVKGSVKSSVKK